MKANKSVGILEVLGKMCNGGYSCKVDLDKVITDTYQRERQDSHVNNIAVNFVPEACGPLEISFRNNKLYCLDGFQRLNALRQGDSPTLEEATTPHATVWDAIVHVGWSKADEGRVFNLVNQKRKRLSGWTMFLADLSSNLYKRRILAILTKYGLSYPKRGTDRHLADVTSTCAIQEAFFADECKGKVLEFICEILSTCWKVDGVMLKGSRKLDILRGMIAYFSDNLPVTKRDRQVVIFAFERLTPQDVRSMANKKRSRGRIDASQVYSALEDLLSPKGLLKLRSKAVLKQRKRKKVA